MHSSNELDFLLAAKEPWVRYNTLKFLLGKSENESDVKEAKRDLLNHPQVTKLLNECIEWPDGPIKRHNDAAHLIHKIVLLSDFGLNKNDPLIPEIIAKIVSNRDPIGSFRSNLMIPKAFGGDGEPKLSWLLCDFPILFYALLSFNIEPTEDIDRAADYLVSIVRENGWPCTGAIQGFRGPGKKTDFCPYATMISLKALSLYPRHSRSEAVKNGVESLLTHWEKKGVEKHYLFGIGSDFMKLKYPNIWYDVLHYIDVLSRFTFATKDERFKEVLEALNSKQGPDGGFKPESVWLAYKDWSFGQKKIVCPWVTYRVSLINTRIKRNVT
jgi:hypothetical protein